MDSGQWIMNDSRPLLSIIHYQLSIKRKIGLQKYVASFKKLAFRPTKHPPQYKSCTMYDV